MKETQIASREKLGDYSEALAAPLVGILTGSPNDLEVVNKARVTRDELGVPCEVRVLSAHRTPDLTLEYVRSAEERGLEVVIACAGMAAHLAGAVASNCLLPVIGVPLASGPLSGLDALLSTVQMPSTVPVASVAVDGARNAAFLAARIWRKSHVRKIYPCCVALAGFDPRLRRQRRRQLERARPGTR